MYQSSMVPAAERLDSFAPVLTAFLDPLLRACRQSADGLGLSDTAVFMLNNIVEMQVAAVTLRSDFSFLSSLPPAL